MTASTAARPVFATLTDAPPPSGSFATLLNAVDSGGRQVVREFLGQPGQVLDLVGDTQANHYVYVLAGAWEIVLDDRIIACSPDTSVLAPKGLTCQAAVTGDESGRLLVLHFPI